MVKESNLTMKVIGKSSQVGYTIFRVYYIGTVEIWRCIYDVSDGRDRYIYI